MFQDDVLSQPKKEGVVMIISLSGPSGIGKGFIKERLLQLYPHIQELAWFTTRLLRPNEKGGNRTHVSVPEFNRMADSSELVLVQDLFGHRYGLRKEDLLPCSDIKLTEVHPDNMLEALRINPEIFAIGLVTFDLSLLHKRLSVVRNTESSAEIEKKELQQPKAKSNQSYSEVHCLLQ